MRSTVWQLRFPAAIMLALGLTGCGFQPLHAPSSNGGAISAALASISIAPPRDRFHQMVRNELMFLISSNDGNGASQYRLDFNLTETESDVLVRRTTQIERRVYLLEAAFKLYDNGITAKTPTPVYKGHEMVKLSYSRTMSEFNNLRARKDARQRTAKAMAEKIHLRLATWMSAKNKTR